METYPVEMLDEYMRLQAVSNDHQIRAVIRFGGHLDLALLERALAAAIERVPLIGCAFVVEQNRRYWQRRSYSARDCIRLAELGGSDVALVEFLGERADDAGPQLVLRVLRTPALDYLLVTVNHAIFDGMGLKAFLYLLGSGYSGAVWGPPNADRRLSTLLKNIALPLAARTLIRRPAPQDGASPLGPADATSCARLYLLRIEPRELAAVKRSCAAAGATLNDMVVAAIGQALLDADPAAKRIALQMMIDLRRYAQRYQPGDFGNFASMEPIAICSESRQLADILQSVVAATRAMKRGAPGLRNILLMQLARRLLSWERFDQALVDVIRRIGVSTTNLGIISSEQLVFGDLAIEDAFILTSLKREPALQVSVSTFRGRMTLAILGQLSERNAAKVAALLGRIERCFHEIQQ